MDSERSAEQTLGARLVEALRRDPVAGWQTVLQALPALGIAAAEHRWLDREIRAHIRLRRAFQRWRQHL
jgi:hypothetical protein